MYALPAGGQDAEFVYYQLTDRDYLFVPRPLVPDDGTTFKDMPAAKYHEFKNRFDAALVAGCGGGRRRESVTYPV